MANNDNDLTVESIDNAVTINNTTEDISNDSGPTTPETIIKHCKYCSPSDNNDNLQTCAKCGSTYCSSHTAKFSPRFCKDCFSNISVIVDKYTRIKDDYDEVNDVVVSNKSSCTRIRLDGPDWVFYTQWVSQLNDDELRSVYEFHYFIVKLIEHDNDIRKVKKQDKLRNTKITPMSISTVKETKVKRETKPKDMQKELEKMGLPVATIKIMLQAAGFEYKENK